MSEQIVNKTLEDIKNQYIRARDALAAAQTILGFSRAAGREVTDLETTFEKHKSELRKWKLALQEYGIIVE